MTNNTYVRLDDVKNLIEKSTSYFENDNCLYMLLEKIESFPTINPIQEIDDMIEEYTGTQTMTDPLIVCCLQELKQRLTK